MKSQKHNSKVKSIALKKTFKFLLACLPVSMVFLTFTFLLLTFNLVVCAIEMNSPQYRIQMSDVNIGAANELESASGNLLSDTLGQLAAGQFNSSGFIVKAGFQYIHSIVPFSFSISDTNIDFGEMIPNYPSTATTDLSVAFGGGGQYQVTVEEQERLKTIVGDNYIDDTCCDVGCSSPGKCTETVAAEWNQDATTGFGYKISGEDIPTTFTTCGATCYRPFSDASIPDEPAVVMSSPNVTVDLSSKPKDIIHQATMTLKLNIDNTQPAGTYQTILNFVATPSF